MAIFFRVVYIIESIKETLEWLLMSEGLKNVRKRKDEQQERMSRGKEIKKEMKQLAIVSLLDRKRKTKTEISQFCWSFKIIARDTAENESYEEFFDKIFGLLHGVEKKTGAIKKKSKIAYEEKHQDTSSIYKYFGELEDEGILKVEIEKPKGRGNAVHWCSLREDYDAFLKVANYLCPNGSTDLSAIGFLNSPYARLMINENLLEHLNLAVKDEHREKLLLMLRVSPHVFHHVKTESPVIQEQKRIFFLKTFSESKDMIETAKSMTSGPYIVSDADISLYEIHFFSDLILRQFTSLAFFSYLPIEEIKKVFDLKKNADGRYAYTVTTTSTFNFFRRKVSTEFSEISGYGVRGSSDIKWFIGQDFKNEKG